MKLDRQLLFLDVETTGTDPCIDRIVELGVSILHPDGTVKPKGWSVRMNPGIPIPAAATDTHHITDADVAECKPFSWYAPKLHSSIQGKDLAGYNLRRFDLPILDEEFRRCGLKLDLTGVQVIDVAGIFFKKNPRKLEDCVRRYCGREPQGYHGAGTDADDTLESLLGQVLEHQELAEMKLDELAAYSQMQEQTPVDIAGNLYRDQEGYVCFGFGKNKGKRVMDQRGYCDWMFKHDFPGSTMDAIRAELTKHFGEKVGARR